MVIRTAGTSGFLHPVYLPALVLVYVYVYAAGFMISCSICLSLALLFGQLFLYFFSGKHLRGLYILGGISRWIVIHDFLHIFPYFYQW